MIPPSVRYIGFGNRRDIAELPGVAGKTIEVAAVLSCESINEIRFPYNLKAMTFANSADAAEKRVYK